MFFSDMSDCQGLKIWHEIHWKGFLTTVWHPNSFLDIQLVVHQELECLYYMFLPKFSSSNASSGLQTLIKRDQIGPSRTEEACKNRVYGQSIHLEPAKNSLTGEPMCSMDIQLYLDLNHILYLVAASVLCCDTVKMRSKCSWERKRLAF